MSSANKKSANHWLAIGKTNTKATSLLKIDIYIYSKIHTANSNTKIRGLETVYINVLRRQMPLRFIMRAKQR